MLTIKEKSLKKSKVDDNWLMKIAIKVNRSEIGEILCRW